MRNQSAPQNVHGEDQVRSAMGQRVDERGRKWLAHDAGVPLTQVYRSEKGPISIPIASELGFTLAWVRMEELDLLAKLERELARPEKLKEGE